MTLNTQNKIEILDLGPRLFRLIICINLISNPNLDPAALQNIKSES